MAEIEYITAGESHGPMLVGVLSYIPAGLKIDNDFVNNELHRRQGGFGRGKRMSIENDTATFVTGVRGHITLGSPITAIIENKDFMAWENIMGEDATDLESKKVTAPRPGHADLSGAIKYNFTDCRNVLERASARETAMKVALGAVCKLYLSALGIKVYSHVTSVGGVTAKIDKLPVDINAAVDGDPVRCLDKEASALMMKKISAAAVAGDTVGGVAQVVVRNVISGIGSYVTLKSKLDGLIMQEVGAVQAVKSVTIGDGNAVCFGPGSAAHDEIFYKNGYYRKTNHAGGIEGGMSNGGDIIVNICVKPIPTLASGLNTVDIETKKQVKAANERSDVCAVPATAVVAEAATAIALSKAISATFGGDTMDEVVDRYNKKAAIGQNKKD